MPLRAALRKMGPRAKIAKPLLRGVVFDLDGTLTVQNLDFKVMHERCGVPAGQDLLQAVAGMNGADRHRAEEIIEEMEAEGRRTLQLATGVIELGKFLQWWSLPTAIVTRNTQETVQSLHDQLWCPHSLPKFWPAVGREFVPPKPHPAALEMIAWQWDVSLGPELLMVGDSPSNDIAFGKAAGVSTVLVDPEGQHRQCQSTMGADFVVDSLAELPRILWQQFRIEGPCVVKKLPPIPANAACHAAAQGDVSALTAMDFKDLAASDETGNTPLIWAADSGNLGAVELLLSAGVDDTAKGFLGNSALSRACRRGDESILRLLLARSTKVIDLPNDKLQTPLHFAAFYQHLRVVQLLLDVGASTTAVDCKGRTPAEACDAETAVGSGREIQGMILQARRAGQILPTQRRA